MNRDDMLALFDSIEAQLATLREAVDSQLPTLRDLLLKSAPAPVSEPPNLPVSKSPSLPVSQPGTWWTGPAEYANRTGVRLNNPLNVKASPNKWQGQIGADERGHVKFESPKYGIRAAMVNLRSYWTKHNLRTLSAIIGRWAPSTDTIGSRKGAPQNQPNQYAAWVAKKLGIGTETQLGLFDREGALRDAAQLIDLITAMAEYEIGAGFTLNRDTAATALLLL